jgi:hypothetical protein
VANPELAYGALAKPAKGTATLERRGKRAEIRTHEQTEKAKVVKRDGAKVCRLVPNCPEKERFETAHLDDKGMGGDHGNRTTADRMIRSCLFHHQGVWSLHSKKLRVECLTERGTDGPIEVWGEDANGQPYMVKRESAAGVLERD